MIAKKNDPAITIRFPREVLDQATKAAQSSGRSRNTEIVVRVAQSLGIVKRGKR